MFLALVDAGGDPSGWKIPSWTLEADIAFNSKERISYTFLSLTAPGAGIVEDSKQAAFCRQVNENAASIRDANPEHYGFFATVPSLLDLSAAKDEIMYALDVLKADGITLFTRYGRDNHYLGHPDFREIWQLLNSRNAVVFIHPTHPVDTSLVNSQLPQPMIDYPHETTRTAVDLIVSSTVKDCGNCKIILSHAGGTLPYLALRPALMLPYIGSRETKSTAEFIEDAKSFYFDTALSSAPTTLDLLSRFAKPDHILFGSDFPYAPTAAIEQLDIMFDEYSNVQSTLGSSINNGAAQKLFPRLRSVLNKV